MLGLKLFYVSKRGPWLLVVRYIGRWVRKRRASFILLCSTVVIFMDVSVKGVRWLLPDNKIHGANIGPTWVLSAPDGPHVGPMNLAIRVINWLYDRSAPVWLEIYVLSQAFVIYVIL